MRAILIAGDEERFFRELSRLRDYLFRECNISSTELIKAADYNKNGLKQKISRAIQREVSSPMLFVYNGHGNVGKCEFAKDRFLFYEELVQLFGQAQSPILFINDCCYAFSVARELEQQHFSYPFGLIAASPADEEAYQFIHEVISSWRKSRIYSPQPFFRIKIDRLLEPIEIVEGGWKALAKHRISKVLNKLNPNFGVFPLVVKVVFPEYKSTPEEIMAENMPICYEHPRWGDTLDFYFFPDKQLKLDFNKP